MRTSNLRLGELLLNYGKISEEELNQALEDQSRFGERLEEILMKKGYISNSDIIEVLEFQLGISHLDLNKIAINPEVVTKVPENLARRYELIAIDEKENQLMVAMADPLNIFAIDDIKICTGYDIQPAIASREDILQSIDRYYRKESAEKMARNLQNPMRLAIHMN